MMRENESKNRFIHSESDSNLLPTWAEILVLRGGHGHTYTRRRRQRCEVLRRDVPVPDG